MTSAAGGAVIRRWLRLVMVLVGFVIVLPLLMLGWQAQTGASGPDVATTVSGADLLRAIELPRAAQDARAAGIAESDLRATLQMLQARGIPAAEARDVLAAYLRLGLSARGEALAPQVEQRLAGGVRGTALAEALRASRPALAPPAVPVAPPRQVPSDSAGERRPLRDTGRIPPPSAERAP